MNDGLDYLFGGAFVLRHPYCWWQQHQPQSQQCAVLAHNLIRWTATLGQPGPVEHSA